MTCDVSVRDYMFVFVSEPGGSGGSRVSYKLFLCNRCHESDGIVLAQAGVVYCRRVL